MKACRKGCGLIGFVMRAGSICDAAQDAVGGVPEQTLLVGPQEDRAVLLRKAATPVTMEIYAKASSKSTREALRRLGESLT